MPSTATPFAGAPQRVIVDTDMGADDWMAILYLLQRPDITVEAITVSGAGLAHCEAGVRNAIGLVALAGGSPIPVACGRETPLQGAHAFPEAWRIGSDTMGGLDLPAATPTDDDRSAAEILVYTILASRGEVRLLTLGPLTNLAEVLLAAPALATDIHMVYIMGGAVEVPGNLVVPGSDLDNQAAEWNIYVDPHAAQVVLDSGAPITLVPLDATNAVPVTRAFYERLQARHDSPESEVVYELLTSQRGWIDAGGFFFWDPLAAAILTDESLATVQTMTIEVVEAEGPESGRTQAASDGAEIRVTVAADGAHFEQVFLDTLNAQSD